MVPEHLDDGLDLATLAEGLDHVEGVCWDPVRRCVWAGGEAGQLYRVALDGTVAVDQVVPGAQFLGLALDGDGTLYCCDVGHGCVWRVEPGGGREQHGERLGYPNYPAFGPDGTLYVSDSGSFVEATGSIAAIAADGTTRRLALDGIAYANGLAVHGDHLYYVESARPGVSRVALAGGATEEVVRMTRCVPDGLSFDENGALYISCYQPNQLWRLSPSGELDCLLDDWTGEFVLSPTNTAFIGDDLDRLVLASLCGHSLTSIDVGVSGAPVPRPLVRVS
jgi:sugar lactone lactonase YvrE